MSIEDLIKYERRNIFVYNDKEYLSEELSGNWDKGFSLAIHTIRSELIGVDASGRNKYDTKRTKIGEMVYQLKYKDDLSLINNLAGLSVALIKKLILANNRLDCIIPIPPSNISRSNQPVFKVAEKISEILKIPFDKNLLEKTTHTNQMKNIEIEERSDKLEGAFTVSVPNFNYNNILLFDDIFESGATARECIKALKSKKENIKVFLLTLTKTRRS